MKRAALCNSRIFDGLKLTFYTTQRTQSTQRTQDSTYAIHAINTRNVRNHFWYNYDQTITQVPIPPRPMYASALPEENGTHETGVKINQNNNKLYLLRSVVTNSPDLSPFADNAAVLRRSTCGENVDRLLCRAYGARRVFQLSRRR